ncbi:hypothetical protein SAMN05192552_10428 [Natrinema hispanicum]|uniref:Uncharacterized protein n=1 Tax=Natrinema hispanicum TaxID=392421 RepID=A0A1G6X1R6_9EURY|nr:hypothetical protein SAMN05192552_10428 [Natrinema hispanicum]
MAVVLMSPRTTTGFLLLMVICQRVFIVPATVKLEKQDFGSNSVQVNLFPRSSLPDWNLIKT